MIKIMPRKRKIHAQLMRINRIDDDNVDNITQFEELYGEYKNFYGKISAYEYVCQNQQYLNKLIDDKNGTVQQVKDFVQNKINEIQSSAKQLNISSKIYNYLNEEQINYIMNYLDNKAINVTDAVNYIYQLCLQSNGMNSNI